MQHVDISPSLEHRKMERVKPANFPGHDKASSRTLGEIVIHIVCVVCGVHEDNASPAIYSNKPTTAEEIQPSCEKNTPRRSMIIMMMLQFPND